MSDYTFAEQMVAFQHLNRMSDTKLAERVEVHPTFIRGIARGAQNPSAGTALKIARVFSHEFAAYISKNDPNILIWEGNVHMFNVAKRGQNRLPRADDLAAMTILHWS